MRERSCREEIWPSWSLRNTVQRQEDPVRSPQASRRIRSERLLSLKGPRWAALSPHARVILPTRSPVRCPLIPRPVHPPHPFPLPSVWQAPWPSASSPSGLPSLRSPRASRAPPPTQPRGTFTSSGLNGPITS